MIRAELVEQVSPASPGLRGKDALAVGRLADDLARVSQEKRVKVHLTVDGTDLCIDELPGVVVAQISELLRDVSEGRDVAIAPADMLIGTENAADILGVSRPWVTQLMDRGEISAQLNGTKRRVRLADIVAYRRADDDRRRAGLDWDVDDADEAWPEG